MTAPVRRASLACALLLAAASAARPAAAQAVYGVWRGTLGTQEVMVDLQPRGCDSSYYYLRHLWGIALSETGGGPSAAWREDAGSSPAATWTFGTPTASGALEGSWTDGRGRRKLPLRLQKVAPGPDEGGSCTHPQAVRAFDTPRVAAQTVTRKDARFDNHPYRRLALSRMNVSSPEVPPSPRPVPRLNRHLLDWQRSQVNRYYSCQLALGPRPGADPVPTDFEASMEPVFWNAHVLVLQENYSYSCGGPHPDSGIANYLTWDLATDQAIEPRRWLRDGGTSPGQWDMPQALATLLQDTYRLGLGKDEPQCMEVIESQGDYLVLPGATGLVFWPNLPHAAKACAEEIVVPHERLQPHLTEEGAVAVRSKIAGASRR